MSVESEIRELVREIVREELCALEREDNGALWMSVEEVARLLSTTPGAIRQRSSSGWLAGDSVRDGKRRFFRRAAVLAELERKRNDPNGR